jgi:hypothetical protein
MEQRQQHKSDSLLSPIFQELITINWFDPPHALAPVPTPCSILDASLTTRAVLESHTTPPAHSSGLAQEATSHGLTAPPCTPVVLHSLHICAATEAPSGRPPAGRLLACQCPAGWKWLPKFFLWTKGTDLKKKLWD